MKRTVLFIATIGILCIFFGSGTMWAGEVDILINKLVEKEILTKSEASLLIEEIQREGAKQQEDIKEVAAETAKEEVMNRIELPEWIEKLEPSFDLRLRHDTQWREKDLSDSTRNRERFRLRFGLKSQVTETTEIGFRLVSGSGYQNTINQSFDSHARGKEIFIDRAYAKWEPSDSFTLLAGKHSNPLFTTPLVWDPDVQPEGVAEIINYNVGDNIRLFGNFSQWFVEELSSEDDDPTLLAFQLGTEINTKNNLKFQFGAAYYDYLNMDSIGHDGDITDNETFVGYNNSHGQQMVFDDQEKLINEWGCLELVAKFSSKELLPLPFSIFGSYVKNLDADISKLTSGGVLLAGTDPAGLLAYGGDNRDTGWQVGFDFGKKEDKGDWYVKYFYQVLEDYAFPGVFVDSDFHNGGTNNKGHKIDTRYIINDKIYANAALYLTERDDISKDGRFDEDRIQLDLVLQFP